MTPTEQYAEIYRPAERNRLLGMYSLLLLLILLPGYLWLLPVLTELMSTAHCQSYAGVHGTVFVTYAVYVGLPLGAAIIMELVLVWKAVRIIRERQSPPRGARVFTRTRIVKGREAVMQGILLMLMVPAATIGLIGWSYMMAHERLQNIPVDQLDYAKCVEIHEIRIGIR